VTLLEAIQTLRTPSAMIQYVGRLRLDHVPSFTMYYNSSHGVRQDIR
jgi:hypothetical protein